MKNIIKNISQALDYNCSTNIRIKQGHDNLVRITAVARFKQDDRDPFFSKWVTYSYANRIYRDLYGKNISESNNFQY